ncbi:MAG: hypothetical protein QOF37_1076 [Thermoleophilaceae bacterium]|nr:hypothetical protein [Thermoleophilaceae bacterium]
MTHRSTAGSFKKMVLTVTASAFLAVGFPVVSYADAGGAHKPVDATHGDCKNSNAGVHNGYDCPAPVPTTTDTGGTDGGTGGVPTDIAM